MKIEKDKVYLRDIRNGRVFPYEEALTHMSYIEKFVGGAEGKPIQRATMHVSLNGQEKAAEFDRLAAMTPDERKAELAKAANTVPNDEEMTSGQTAENEVEEKDAAKKTAEAPKPPAPKPPAPKPPAPPAAKK